MEKDEKKVKKEGLFKRLFGAGSAKPCCGGVQLEEIPPEQADSEPGVTGGNEHGRNSQG